MLLEHQIRTIENFKLFIAKHDLEIKRQYSGNGYSAGVPGAKVITGTHQALALPPTEMATYDMPQTQLEDFASPDEAILALALSSVGGTMFVEASSREVKIPDLRPDLSEHAEVPSEPAEQPVHIRRRRIGFNTSD